MREIAAASLAFLLFLTTATARTPLAVRLALLPALLLAAVALFRQPVWPVPILILLLGGGVLWSLASRLKVGRLSVELEADAEDEPTTKPLERALKMAPDTDPPLVVLVTQVLVAGALLVCARWTGEFQIGAACLGALLVGFLVALLLVRRPVSTWGVSVALAWAAWAAWPGLRAEPLFLLTGVGLGGALILGSIRDSAHMGIVAVMLALLAAVTAVRPGSGLVSWFAGWALLIGLVLLYLLVGLGSILEGER